MAFYYVNDGVVDTAVSFEDGSEFASFAQFMRSSVANELGNIYGNRANVAAGVAPVDISPDRGDGYEGQTYNVFAFSSPDAETTWFALEDLPVGPDQNLAGTNYTDPDSFGAGSITASITLSGTNFNDGDSFGAGVISTDITVSGTIYNDPDAFGAGVISQGGATQNITGSLYTDPDSFGAGTVDASITIQGANFADADSFGSGAISQGTVDQTITGTLFVDPDSFGSGIIIGGEITQPDDGGAPYDPWSARERAKIRARRKHEHDDDKPPLEVIKIGKAPQQVVITGIVQPARKSAIKVATDITARLEQDRVTALSKRKQRIRAMQMADDEWLMTA